MTYQQPTAPLISGMSNLRMIRRMVTGLAVLTFAVLVIVGQRPAPSVAAAPVHRPSVMSQMHWSPALAHRFTGCAAKVHGVPSAFVVERLSGKVQRMSFDEAWKRTHDKQHADDVWVRGACK